jgi:UDP-N-acetylmuramate--alanine ligase
LIRRIRKIGEIGGVRVVKYHGLKKSRGKLKLPGEHIRSDAAAAAASAKALGVKEKVVKQALEEFGGLERRFEFRGAFRDVRGVGEVRIYDDYAHHPTAVAANIKAARELYPRMRIWAVFQPHMHARLEALFAGFVKSLKMADRVIVTDVFTRREQEVTKPSGKDLALAIGAPKATYVGGDLENVAKFVARNVPAGAMVLVMGAGDVYKVSDYLLKTD